MTQGGEPHEHLAAKVEAGTLARLSIAPVAMIRALKTLPLIR